MDKTQARKLKRRCIEQSRTNDKTREWAAFVRSSRWRSLCLTRGQTFATDRKHRGQAQHNVLGDLERKSRVTTKNNNAQNKERVESMASFF